MSPSVGQRLDVLARLTQDGEREPALRERRAASLGAFVEREVESAEAADQAARNGLLEAISLYFVTWPDDGVDPEEMPQADFLQRL